MKDHVAPASAPTSLFSGLWRPTVGNLVALAVVTILGSAFLLNNLAPYLGLPFAGPMTMFSGLTANGDNHYFMPKLSLGEADTYVTIVLVQSKNIDTPELQRFQAFAKWTRQQRRVVNLNFVRYQASVVCGSAPAASIRLTLQTAADERLNYPNVCDEPAMLRFDLLSKYEECKPDCLRFIRDWALGKIVVE